ncbi:MAG: rhodanese-like domain-containing protein, partial [Vulcanimicrobiaceae bacterium]
EPLAGRLLLVDSLAGGTHTVRFDRDPGCALCGSAPTISDAREDLPGEDDARDDDVLPEELDRALTDAVLLDVREPHEVVLGIIPGAVHIPASQFEARLHELDTARTYIVACRVGQKSQWALARLHDAGFTRVRHLRGGLLAYAAQFPEFGFF